MLHSAPVVGGSSARLFLDAIGAPVVARVTHRSADRMTVSRELPFLKLHSSVHDEGGRRAEVTSVSVIVEDGTPRLVLELAYDDAEAKAAIQAGLPRAGRDDTVPYVFERPAAKVARTARSSRHREETLQFVTERAALGSQEQALAVAHPDVSLLVLVRAAAHALLRTLRALATGAR